MRTAPIRHARSRCITNTAADIETLGETVRTRVRETSGVELDWEIKRIGVS